MEKSSCQHQEVQNKDAFKEAGEDKPFYVSFSYLIILVFAKRLKVIFQRVFNALSKFCILLLLLK